MVRNRATHIRSLARAATALWLIAAMPGRAADRAGIDFHIAEGPLAQALGAYSQVTGRQLLYPSNLVAGKHAPALDGRMSPDAALARLLAGTAIHVRHPGGMVVILSAYPALQVGKTPVSSPPPAQRVPVLDRGTGDQQPAPEIVVTGTNIRGAGQIASPLTTIRREDIDKRGLGTVVTTTR